LRAWREEGVVDLEEGRIILRRPVELKRLLETR
jgi:hypothetical protein